MKRIILLTFLILAAISVNGQKKVGTCTLYPRIGLNYSKFSDKNPVYILHHTKYSKSKYKKGFVIGAEVQRQVIPLLAISGGLLYSQQGSYIEELDTHKQLCIRNNNIILPLSLLLTTKPGLSARIGVQAEYKINNAFNKDLAIMNIDIPIGLSYEFKNVCIDLRYIMGLNHVYRNFAVYQPEPVIAYPNIHFGRGEYLKHQIYNQTIMLTLGYGIDL